MFHPSVAGAASRGDHQLHVGRRRRCLHGVQGQGLEERGEQRQTAAPALQEIPTEIELGATRRTRCDHGVFVQYRKHLFWNKCEHVKQNSCVNFACTRKYRIMVNGTKDSFIFTRIGNMKKEHHTTV